MKKLFTNEEFELAKNKALLPLECYQCNNTFHKTKHYIQQSFNPTQNNQGKFCSYTCSNHYYHPQVNVECVECGTKFIKKPSQAKRSTNHFCSRSCSASYNNKNKTHGTRRSKLEVYIEQQLAIIYPNVPIEYNSKDAIQSELDVYLPSLALAFELNGIFHYEPIYGNDKLNQIQNNDNRKYQACLEQGIELCIIDTSSQKYFKEQTADKFLSIIRTIIDSKL